MEVEAAKRGQPASASDSLGCGGGGGAEDSGALFIPLPLSCALLRLWRSG